MFGDFVLFLEAIQNQCLMSFIKTITSKPFLTHLAIVLGSGLLLIVLAFVAINLYTLHGEGHSVPDFTGLTEQQLSHLAEQKQLRYAIIDSVHIDDMPRGVVVEQEPHAGELVKRNRNIFLTINAWSPEKVQVPNLVDYSIRNARVMLESFGLTVGDLIFVPSEYTNLVLGQHLNGKPVQPGTQVVKGTRIDLLVGQGLSSQMTAVPNLKGLSLEDAKEESQRVSLNIGAAIYDSTVVTGPDTLAAFVWRQSPAASPGNQLNLGASIDIWLTTDSALIMPDSLASDPSEWDNEQTETEEEKFY